MVSEKEKLEALEKARELEKEKIETEKELKDDDGEFQKEVKDLKEMMEPIEGEAAKEETEEKKKAADTPLPPLNNEKIKQKKSF